MSFTTGLTLYASSSFTTGVNFTFHSVLVGESNTSLLSTGIATFTGQVLSVSAPINSISNLTSGTLNFLGGKLFSLSSTIQGTDNFTVTVQGLHDYYNVNSLYTFAVDAWFPYISDVSKDLVGFSLVTNNSRATHTHTILGGGIDCSYLMDFYNRIHLSPVTMNLGQVIDTKVVYSAIWNSYFVSKTITSIVNVNLPDITMNFPMSIPATLTFLRNVIFSITVNRLGVPNILGSFNFIVDGHVNNYNIIGFRALFWPFNSLSSCKEIRTYSTDVIPCRSQESRSIIRTIPRLQLTYSFLFKTNAEFSLAKSLGKYVTSLPIAMPLWTDAIKLTDLSSGQTVINCKTATYEYAVGSIVVFWKSYLVWEIGSIFSMNSTSITLEQPLTSSYASCFLVPIYAGYSTSSLDISSQEHYVKTASISIVSVTPFYEPIPFFTNYFNALPILDLSLVVSGGVINGYKREQVEVASTVGNVVRIDVETYTRERTNINLFSANHSQLNTLRRGFDFIQGKFNAFWLPSSQQDGFPLSNITVGSEFIIVKNYSFSTYPMDYIRIIGTDATGIVQIPQCYTVVSIIVNSDNTETINFFPPTTVPIVKVTQVQILLKVRLDTDVITYNHQPRGTTLVNTNVVEVVN